MKRILSLSALLFLFMLPPPVHAQWLEGGLKVVDEPGNQNIAVITVDEAGNTTIAWNDSRSGTMDIYARRYDPYGHAIWPETAVCTVTGSQSAMEIIADAAGGVILAWSDTRNGDYDIYAQRLDASGAAVWTAGGILICGEINNQYSVVLKGDGDGGAVMAWQDYRSDSDGDIYAQRVDASGTALWTLDGRPVCTDGNRQDFVVMDATSDGGLVVAWRDNRLGAYNIYGNRVEGDGDLAWGSSGTQICGAIGGQYHPQILHDGNNGAFVVWQDYRAVVYDIYAQRMSYNGFDQWVTDGIPVCDALGDQGYPVMCLDGNGGVIIAWQDERNSITTWTDVYAQRVDYWGHELWTSDGVVVSEDYGYQQRPQICSDGAGGVMIAWDDMRAGAHDVYATRFDDDGTTLWPANGVKVLEGALGASGPGPLAGNGAGGAVFVQTFQKPGTGYWEPYLQRIDRFGYWGHPSATVTGAGDVPGDEGGYVSVEWDASRLDPWPDNAIDHYTVWRSISGPAATAMVKRGDAVFTSGVDPLQQKSIRVQQLAGETFYWEQVDEVAASSLGSYACTAPTLFDTTSTVQSPHYWQVVAHHIATGYWFSAPMPGSSGDNLAPSAPLNLTAARAATDVELEWNAVGVSDLAHYAVYRSESSAFTPGPGSFLTVAADTFLTDTTADPAKTLYYKVTAFDVHENESAASNQAVAEVVTGVEDRAPALTRLQVLTNVPNPFDRTTELRIGLPAPGSVAIGVYDVAGRRVLERTAVLDRGWQRVTLDGSALPSGVYFYRVRAAGQTVTRKLVIRR
jgi:hypothetical protein